VSDSAFELAALRAQRTRRISPGVYSTVANAAERVGQRIVEVRDPDGSTSHTLGWADGYEPVPYAETFSVRRLPQVAQVALGVCIGLCWLDRDVAPYPGVAVPFDDAVAATVKLGVDYKHVVGALRGELQFAGLLVETDERLRLGPAVAAWPSAQVELLRRAADTLPGASGA
jgi:hypothetical protein